MMVGETVVLLPSGPMTGRSTPPNCSLNKLELEIRGPLLSTATMASQQDAIAAFISGQEY
jgi:hypothetical protein